MIALRLKASISCYHESRQCATFASFRRSGRMSLSQPQPTVLLCEARNRCTTVSSNLLAYVHGVYFHITPTLHTVYIWQHSPTIPTPMQVLVLAWHFTLPIAGQCPCIVGPHNVRYCWGPAAPRKFLDPQHISWHARNAHVYALVSG